MGGVFSTGGVYEMGGVPNTPPSGTKYPTPPVSGTAPVPYQIPPIEKVEREERIETVTPPSFDADVPPPTEADFCLEPVAEPVHVQTAKTPKKKSAQKRVLIKPDDCSQEVFDEWVAYKDSLKGKTKCSQRMVDFIAKEAKAARLTSERAMVICMEHGWMSFQASFMKNLAQEPADNPFRVTPEQKRSIFAARQQRQQQPEFRDLKAPRYADEFDADAVNMLKGVI